MKVKALRDIAGGYGFCPIGGVMNITEAAAKELEQAGLVEIVGEAAPEEPEVDSEKEREKRAKKPSVRLKNAE